MGSVLESNSSLESLSLRTKTVQFRVTIGSNATPASKTHYTELKSFGYLRTEGKTATADAVEDLSALWTTAVDNSTGDSVFGLLIKGGYGYLGNVLRCHEVRLVQNRSTATITSLTPAFLNTGSVSFGLSSEGNVAIQFTGTGVNLASENVDAIIELSYVVKE